MPKSLTLIESDDKRKIQDIAKKCFPDQKIITSVEPEYDTEIYKVLIKIDITNEKLNKAFYKKAKEMHVCISDIGDHTFEINVKCKKCQSWNYIDEDSSERQFFCLKCYEEKNEPVYKCKICKKTYEVDRGWIVNLSASVKDNKDKHIVNAVDKFDVFKDSIYSRDCCSEVCAKQEFKKWMKKLLDHPWSKNN